MVSDSRRASSDLKNERIVKRAGMTQKLSQMKYLYDGDQTIAEYDGNNSLLHKYIYGPGVDQPICMIDVENSSATYYYHFDGLGSVIALTNSAGSVVNLYEYSVFGEVSASDPNHPNRFLFTGREFDADTGLYYYRARYYNPYIGRFLQTDPLEYGVGPNLYLYCKNSPLSWADHSGLEPVLLNPYDAPKDWKWERRGGNHPKVYPPDWPYYEQNDAMACVPAATLNFLLTYNRPIPHAAEEEIDSDSQALDHVKSLYDGEWRIHDWNREGVKMLEKMQSIVHFGSIMHGLTVENVITRVVVHHQAMVTAVNMSNVEGIDAWHCILIAPRPKGLQKVEPGYTIALISSGVGGTSTWAYGYTPDAFKIWWSSWKRGIGGTFLVGGTVPGQTSR